MAAARRSVLQLFAQWPTQRLEFDPLRMCEEGQLFALLKLAYAAGDAARRAFQQSLQAVLTASAPQPTKTAAAGGGAGAGAGACPTKPKKAPTSSLTFAFATAGRILFGRGRSAEVPALVASYGK